MSRTWIGLWLLVFLVIAGVVTALCTLLTQDLHAPKRSVTPDTPNPQITEVWPKRLPIAGVEGFTVVLEQDGSSYIEDAAGKVVRQLTDASSELTAIPIVPVVSPKRNSLGQLVVCAKGVVDIPKNVIITFVGDDKVVVHNPDGSSVIYYVDGRVEQHSRMPNKLP